MRWSKVFFLAVAGLFIVPALLVSVLAHLDRCPQHSTAQSRSITQVVAESLRSKGYFTIREISDRKPLFYCLAGTKADFSELRAMQRRSAIRFPSMSSFVGSGVGAPGCYCSTRTISWMPKFPISWEMAPKCLAFKTPGKGSERSTTALPETSSVAARAP